jgi:hypothetical protein
MNISMKSAKELKESHALDDKKMFWIKTEDMCRLFDRTSVCYLNKTDPSSFFSSTTFEAVHETGIFAYGALELDVP